MPESSHPDEIMSGERPDGMAKVARTDRFPAAALAILLDQRPFPQALWEAATSPMLQVRIGNAPAQGGQATALAALRVFLGCSEGFGRGFREIWAVKEAILIESDLEFREPGNQTRRIPCFVVARTTHGLLHDLRFHLDPSPLRTPDAVTSLRQ